jgi:hypothetical protein
MTAVGVVLLDRFNNSAYGQTVYRKVKTFFKLDIEIDEENLQKQVSEITETDYFRDLQDSVKSLRQRSDTPVPKRVPSVLLDSFSYPIQPDTPSAPQPDPQPDPQYLDPQYGEGEPTVPVVAALSPQTPQPLSLDLDRSVTPRPLTPSPVAPSATPPDFQTAAVSYELDYIQQIQQATQQLKFPVASAEPAEVDPLPPGLRLVLEDAFCRHEDASQSTQEYITFIEQEIQLLKSQISAQISGR